MNYKLAMIGVILFTLGTTLAAASYFNLYRMVEANIPYPNTILMTGRYYVEIDDFNLDYTGIQRVGVFISGSRELQSIVNSTLNYNTTLGFKPITISLSFGERMSASVTPLYALYGQGLVAVHYFDVPSYSPWSTITVTNPEDYPVCWGITVMHYSEIINENWLVALLVGIITVVLGLIMVGIAFHKRKPTVKQKETATVS